MKRTVKWILVLIAILAVLALAAGTAGAEGKRTLQLEFPINPTRRSAASVSGPNSDHPVTCEEYTFTVNNGTDTNVASYRYIVGTVEDGSTMAETFYISNQTTESTFSYTFLLPGTYVLFVDRYNSAGNEAATQLQCSFEILDNEDHANNPLYAKISEIVSHATGSPWEKAVYLHDWLTGNAYYDYNYEYYGEDGVLLHEKGVCNSYARAFELLCREAGIPVSRVRGTGTNSSGESEPHAWNAIQLEGQWYLVDVTWDDPSKAGSTVTVTGKENHNYFCLNDSLMGLDHNNNESLFADGQCNSLAANYLLRMGDKLAMGDGIVRSGNSPDYYTDRIKNQITAYLAQEETEFSVLCENTFYALSNVTDTGSYSYSSDSAGSARAICGWTLLGVWMSENGFILEGEEGEASVRVQATVSYDRDKNEFLCSVTSTETLIEPTWDWSYEEGEEMISVTGTGPLELNGEAPWLGKGYDISRIMIGEGITSIGAGVFAGLDNGVRIDFLQEVLPAFAENAFGGTTAVCRYLSDDDSWNTVPSSANVSWVWMPTFNFRAAGTFGELWLEKDQETPGWSIKVNADGEPRTYTNMPAATAHELIRYCFDVCLNTIPSGADLAVINHVESDDWELYFATGCSGNLTLDSASCSVMPVSISVSAPELNLTVTCSSEGSLRELYVTEGTVDYTGDVQKVLLECTPSDHTGTVRINGSIGELAYYGEESEDPFRGTLTVTGGINSGMVYGGWDGTMAIHGVTDAYPLSGVPGKQFAELTGLDNTPVILYDDTEHTSSLNPVIETEGGIEPTIDMFRLRYILGGLGNNTLMMRPREDAGIGSELLYVNIDEYNANFLNDLQENVVWGSETELYVSGFDVTLPGGSDGKGLGELSAGGNCTVTVQCPVQTLLFQPDPQQKNHITFYIEDSVSLAYLQPNNCSLDLTLRNGGSISSGRWKQLLRDYRNFGPLTANASQTLPVVSDSALLVMSWTYAQGHGSILPSDAAVTNAAGTQAMADLKEAELTQEEEDALAAVADGNDVFALDKSKIAWVFDVSLNAYSVDENGEATKGEEIGDLNGNTIPILINNPTGNPDAFVIRLHEENGVLTARKLDTSNDGDIATFASDLFSTYLLTEPGEIIPVPEMEEPTFVTPANLTSIGDQAFSGISVRIVKITENVETIGNLAFENSGAVQAIIMNADTEISDSAFSGCENLIVFGVPDGEVQDWADRNHIQFYPIPQD